MLGVDPVTGSVNRWSLRPEDTLGFIFWTRNPENLLRDRALLAPYKVVVHFTLTGWHEVEHKAPRIEEGLDLLDRTVQAFGPENVTWRFSPIPVLEQAEVVARFQRIADRVVMLGLREVYLSFLQTNDSLREGRLVEQRRELLRQLAGVTSMDLLLCNEDANTLDQGEALGRVRRGICEDGRRFSKEPRIEGCGCTLAVDPFTINESCVYGCEYCYAADKTLAPKKRNTTRSLTVVQ